MNDLRNAGKPWKLEEVVLVASTAPTKQNVKNFAQIFGRTEHSIQYLYCKIYKTNTSYLKEHANNGNQCDLILKARKMLKYSF